MNLISVYFPELQHDRLVLLEKYAKLLIEWNAKINVISRKDIDSIEERHILHSLSLVKLFSFSASSQIADVGSGGGFPGIPIAIFCPQIQVSLIESIRKKANVLCDMVNALGLTNVTVENVRTEDISKKYDFVIGRAVAAFPDFYNIVKHLVSLKSRNEFANGILYLKGGDFSGELSGFSRAKIFSIQTVFSESYFETKKLIYLPFSR
ncbi:MAG TPA: 16S rRNA (guanine(527)-N(7))-methyltransferase RsmG [Bacteroidales bacterium]|nr:16S rRNA (guanine(527)-N(7))-methyltransferase RsmG [Bacteroidales bacterium]